jgi:signal transduction histidine kinase
MTETAVQKAASLRVLWVEDEPAHVDMGRAFLERAGFKVDVHVVATREDYSRTLRADVYDLVIADYQLAGWTGLEALDLLRKIDSHTPFILLTGTLPEEIATECIDKGITDYVLKSNLARLTVSVRLALVHRNTQRRLTRSREQLRNLAARLQSIREEERSRIAREVHDVLGQALTGIKMDARWILARLPEIQGPLVTRAQSMSELIDSTIHTVRRIASDLRPGILDNLGLVAAVEWQASEFQTRTGINCRVTNTLRDAAIGAESATAVFRIFQETLTNVARHAQATAVSVDLGEQEGRIVLQVADNGRGIDLAEVTQSKSVGLLGMRERAAILGGDLVISGAPGQGTSVVLSVPLEAPAPVLTPGPSSPALRTSPSPTPAPL